jgi:hypothetical protein
VHIFRPDSEVSPYTDEQLVEVLGEKLRQSRFSVEGVDAAFEPFRKSVAVVTVAVSTAIRLTMQ